MDYPDHVSENMAQKHWAKIPENVRHKIITTALCVVCGATIITDFVMQGDVDGITFMGSVAKLSMTGFWPSSILAFSLLLLRLAF